MTCLDAESLPTPRRDAGPMGVPIQVRTAVRSARGRIPDRRASCARPHACQSPPMVPYLGRRREQVGTPIKGATRDDRPCCRSPRIAPLRRASPAPSGWTVGIRPAGMTKSTPAEDDARPASLLYVATVSGTIRQFLKPIANSLRAHGWRLGGAAAGVVADPTLPEAFDELFELPLSRSLRDVGSLVRGERAIARMLRESRPDIVHVHSPIASFLTRLAVRRMPRERRAGRRLHGARIPLLRGWPSPVELRVSLRRTGRRSLDRPPRGYQRRGSAGRHPLTGSCPPGRSSGCPGSESTPIITPAPPWRTQWSSLVGAARTTAIPRRALLRVRGRVLQEQAPGGRHRSTGTACAIDGLGSSCSATARNGRSSRSWRTVSG